MAELFGFTITRKSEEKEQERQPSIVLPPAEDGSIEVAAGGVYGTYVDLEGSAKNETELVTKYREMSVQAECDSAIQDIVNEAIVMDDSTGILEIVLDEIEEIPESIKKKIKDEFDYIIKLLDFNNDGYDIFKKWYVDGRLYYYLVIDEKNPKAGIKELKYIDPRRIKKIREAIRDKDPRTGATIYKGTREYYIYNQSNARNQMGNTGVPMSAAGVKIAKDSIVYVHSGVLDARKSTVYSHLHKAIKPLNQLRMLEDAVVIYRLSRAPERRIFYIDVGNLPKGKAEQYLRDMMVRHKNKLVYDASTGEVRDDRKFMTMLEDFWLPRREGGRGTEITTLPGGQNLGEMEDVDYFRRKLYKSLNVPVSRLETEAQFNLGRSSEITRDEVKFSKFIQRLRHRFSELFDDLLEVQLALKGVCTRKEWQRIKQEVYYDFNEDNQFSELKDIEMLRERMQVLQDVDQYVGKYFSTDWIKKNVLKFTEEEIEEMDEEMQDEAEQTADEAPSPDSDEEQGGEEDQQQQQQYVLKPAPAPKNEEVELTEAMTNFLNKMAE